jgi:hypothetical protein
VVAGDFDHDMDLDLYVVCTGQSYQRANRLLLNDGRGRFTVAPDSVGAAGTLRGIGDSVATADYDGDGFLDLFITNGHGPAIFADDGPHQLLRNLGNGNHWLQLDLRGTRSNRDGIGAVVELEAGGVKQWRVRDGGIHGASQNFPRIHFGLGKSVVADRIIIRWPSGVEQTLTDVAADRILPITESPPTP